MTDLSSDPVNSQERISRFLLRPKWFDLGKKCVFAQAFRPPRVTVELPVRLTSVYRTEACSEPEIWQIGKEFVTKLHPQKLPVLGRADLVANNFFDIDLSIVPFPNPHPKHADIEGWPDDDLIMETKLAYLASKAKLIPAA